MLELGEIGVDSAYDGDAGVADGVEGEAVEPSVNCTGAGLLIDTYAKKPPIKTMTSTAIIMYPDEVFGALRLLGV